MTKAERLLFIVNLFRVKKKITLDELQQECGVSKRTIFRDLLALSSMNIPIYYDNGYRLARDISLPALNFTDEEQEILGYCLKHTDLAKSPELKNKLRNIELKILSAIPGRKKSSLGGNFIEANDPNPGLSSHQDIIVADFFKAMFNNLEFSVTLKARRKTFKGLYAVSIIIVKNAWQLVMTDRKKEGTINIPIDKIHHIKLIDN